MKLIPCLFAAVCLCACASHSQREAKTSYDTYFPPSNLPPTDLELTVENTKTLPNRTLLVEEEQQKYEESIRKINSQMTDEVLLLQMYEAVHPKTSKEYKAYLKQMCEIDVLLDSKGDHHRKPYCILT